MSSGRPCLSQPETERERERRKGVPSLIACPLTWQPSSCTTTVLPPHWIITLTNHCVASHQLSIFLCNSSRPPNGDHMISIYLFIYPFAILLHFFYFREKKKGLCSLNGILGRLSLSVYVYLSTRHCNRFHAHAVTLLSHICLLPALLFFRTPSASSPSSCRFFSIWHIHARADTHWASLCRATPIPLHHYGWRYQ